MIVRLCIFFCVATVYKLLNSHHNCHSKLFSAPYKINQVGNNFQHLKTWLFHFTIRICRYFWDARKLNIKLSRKWSNFVVEGESLQIITR